MVRRETAYAISCVFGVLVIGLGPSISQNIWPSLAHYQWDMAFVQGIFVLGAAMVAWVIPKIKWYWVLPAIALWAILEAGCFWSGVEAVALTRGNISSGRDAKIHLTGEWDTQIEKWSGEQAELKRKYKPVDREDGYAPTPEASVAAAQRGKDDATKIRDTACKYTTPANSPDCRGATQKMEAAQEKLERITQNRDLTERVDKLEKAIEEARVERVKIGTPPPDYLQQAAKILSRLTSIDQQTLMEDKAVYTAMLADLWGGAGPAIVLLGIALVFQQLYGEDWRASPPKIDSPSQSQIHLAQVTTPASPPKAKKASPQRALYAEGVKAWVETVKPTPGAEVKKYPPGKVHLDYVQFCEVNGFTPCQVQLLGSIFIHECALVPKKRGGQNYYEFALRPKLSLVKTGKQPVATAV